MKVFFPYGAIVGAMIKDESVGAADLGPNSVNTSELVDAAVTAAKIAKTADGALDLTGSVAEGLNNTASGIQSHAEGRNNIASGIQSHTEGNTTEASGDQSHAEGCDTIAVGKYAHAEGDATEAVAEGSHAEGSYSKAYLFGQHAQAGEQFTAVGDAQHSRIVLHQLVTHDDANWHSIGAVARCTIPLDTLWTFDILLSGATAGMAKTFSYHIIGSIKNDGDASELNAMIRTAIYEDDADFDAQVLAYPEYNILDIQVKDATSGGDVVRWVADVRLCEVGFPAA